MQSRFQAFATHTSNDLCDAFLSVSLKCEILGFLSNEWNVNSDYGHCHCI